MAPRPGFASGHLPQVGPCETVRSVGDCNYDSLKCAKSEVAARVDQLFVLMEENEKAIHQLRQKLEPIINPGLIAPEGELKAAVPAPQFSPLVGELTALIERCHRQLDWIRSIYTQVEI